MPQLTKSQWVDRARLKHGDAFDYTKTIYTRIKDPVTVMCTTCKTLTTHPAVVHLRFDGCAPCTKQRQVDAFLSKAKELRGKWCDYSDTVYVDARTKVTIKCRDCGETFSQLPSSHLNSGGLGCPKCTRRDSIREPRQIRTFDDWCVKARTIHGEKFDYSKVEYTGTGDKVHITCRDCGLDIYQRAGSHLEGRGCKVCVGLIMTRATFIYKARRIHNDRYSYDVTGDVTSSQDMVTIHCNECTIDFQQRVTTHLAGCGCPPCGGHTNYTTENVITDAKLIYPGRFSYEKTVYTKMVDPIIVTCTLCFKDTELIANNLINSGTAACHWCSKTRARTTAEFIEKAREVHGDEYTYDKVDYINNDTVVTIECLKCERDFQQLPRVHIYSQSGCPRCASLKSERMAVEALEEATGKQFKKVRPKWLKGLELDAYNEELRMALEYNGIQHYEYHPWFHKSLEDFQRQCERDEQKRTILAQKGIHLITVPHTLNFQTPERLRSFVQIAAI